MKTRAELLLDFMVALSSNPNMTKVGQTDKEMARDIFLLASELSDITYPSWEAINDQL